MSNSIFPRSKACGSMGLGNINCRRVVWHTRQSEIGHHRGVVVRHTPNCFVFYILRTTGGTRIKGVLCNASYQSEIDLHSRCRRRRPNCFVFALYGQLGNKHIEGPIISKYLPPFYLHFPLSDHSQNPISLPALSNS